jgi:hypothetical protein
MMSTLLSVSLLSGTASAAESASIQLTFNNGGTLSSVVSDQALIKGGVSYFPAYIARAAGLEISWDRSSGRAVFRGWDKSFAVRLGSRTGILDGKTIDLGREPFLHNNQLFVPAKFLVKALEGGTLRWNAEKRTFYANNLHLYRKYSETYKGSIYSVSLDTGELRVSSGMGGSVKIADLGTGLDVLDFTFEQTPGGLLVMRIRNNYGEPHVHNEWITLVLKNSSVIRQTSTSFNTTFSEPSLWWDGRLLLSDGRTLRIIEDGTGDVVESIDLGALMSEVPSSGYDATNVTYNVEAWDDDFALIRPGNTGLLTLVDRTAGQRIPLYREFFGPEKQKELELTDPMFPGDKLRFAGRSGNILKFTRGSGEDFAEFTYDLSKPQR